MSSNYYPRGADPQHLDALDAQSDALHGDLDDHIVVSSAESTVRSARIVKLQQAHQEARRQVTAAKGRLTRVVKTGDAQAIAAAQQHLANMDAAWKAALETAIAEGHQLVATGLERLGETNRKISASWDAANAAMDARFGTRSSHRKGDPQE